MPDAALRGIGHKAPSRRAPSLDFYFRTPVNVKLIVRPSSVVTTDSV